MGEYIDREALRAKISPWLDGTVLVMSVQALDEAPAADVAEVRHGKWKFLKNWDCFVCSECSFEHANYSRYCPNCGARMV